MQTIPRAHAMKVLPRCFVVFIAATVLAGCATGFPQASGPFDAPDGLDGPSVLALSVSAHGGDLRKRPGDLNYSSDGRWYSLIQRIQPVVSDAGYRVKSQALYSPSQGLYAVRHEGPKGVKQVVRTAGAIEVYYNGVRVTEPDTLSATAMTSDAFELFHFGPTFLTARATRVVRMPDAIEEGQRYLRVQADIAPGFGDAANDKVVAWFDPETYLLHRVHMTLNGFSATQGAHVDTTLTGYRDLGGVMVPTRFHERVRGPLQINAHTWRVTGMDADRGWQPRDVADGRFTGPAKRLAAPMGSLPTD